MMMNIFGYFLFFLVGYFFGSVPYGVFISRIFCGIDPRSAGSGNIGATNVARLCGKKWGMLTLLCDLGKGALAVACCMYLRPDDSVLFLLAPALGALLGHMYPVYLRFKGGKGVATTVGIYFVLAPWAMLIAGPLCLAVIALTGYVSAGALAMCAALPVILFFSGSIELGWFAVLTGLLVVFAHRENIRRLQAGEEKTWKRQDR